MKVTKGGRPNRTANKFGDQNNDLTLREMQRSKVGKAATEVQNKLAMGL